MLTMTPRTERSGFTLVETMVAIAILAVALVGPFVAIRTSLIASYIARDELIASSLAQEGMEYIRSVRDNNYLNGRTWMDGLSNYSCYISAADYCILDPRLGDLHTTPSAMQQAGTVPSAITPLYLTTGGIYTYGSGTATSFRRYVQLTSVNAHEVRVTVTVQWTTSGQTYSVVVTDSLQDWI